MNLHLGYTQWGCGLKFQSGQIRDVQNFVNLMFYWIGAPAGSSAHVLHSYDGAWVGPQQCWQ